MLITRLTSKQALRKTASAGLSAATQRTAVTIGNFDGVHRGHQALFAALEEQAKALNLKKKIFS